MNTYHAAPWSSPSSSECRYRTTHHQRTKQLGEEDWTWEQAEAAGEGNRRYEGTRLARKPEKQPPPQKQIGGYTGSMAESGWRPEPTPRGDHGTGQALGYGVKLEVSKGSEAETVKELMGRLEERAMRELLCWCMRHDFRPTERVRDLMSPESALHTRPNVRASRLVKTVPAPRTRPPVRPTSPARPVPARRYSSPIRALSPVRYIPAPRICRARVRFQPGRMVPALLSRTPVRLLRPGYPASALRTVSPVWLHSPVRPVPAPRTCWAKITIQPGRVVQALSSRPPVCLHGRSILCLLH